MPLLNYTLQTERGGTGAGWSAAQRGGVHAAQLKRFVKALRARIKRAHGCDTPRVRARAYHRGCIDLYDIYIRQIERDRRPRAFRVPRRLMASSSRCPSHCPGLCTLYFQLTPFNTVSCPPPLALYYPGSAIPTAIWLLPNSESSTRAL